MKNRHPSTFQVVLIIQIALGIVSGWCGAEVLPPPFGLKWGDPPARLVDWAVRTKLDQIVKSPASDPDLKILMISSAAGSLPDHDASSLEARFVEGRLFEVTIHFIYPGQSADFVRGQFAELKGILARQYGSFRPAGQRRAGPKEGIETRSTAYRIDPSADRSLTLVLTEVTDTVRADAAAQFSVMYHNAGVLVRRGARVVIRREGVERPEESQESEEP